MIYVINRYNQKRGFKNFSGYEQIVKYDNSFKIVESPNWFAKIVSFFFKKPKNYLVITYGREMFAFLFAIITGKPIFYLYADKDAFLVPILKRKLNLKRIRIYGTLHWPLEISNQYSFYEYNLSETFNGVITLSTNNKLKLKTSRKVIPHGIDLEFWYNKSIKLNNDSFWLILGQSNRNHKEQIKIIKEILKINSRAQFIALINKKELIKEYGKIRNVQILKNRISDWELKKMYIECKGVILIQKFCLASNVVLETIAMSRPLIANRVGDIEDYVGEDHNFIDLDNPNEFLLEFCQSNIKRKEMMDKFSVLRENYQWNKIAQQTKCFIK